IIEAAEREKVDAIGLSGLLVKSTVVMREDLEELNRRDLSHWPVILGGAALTRSYVEGDLRTIYNGKVFYGRDAFEGLHTMDALMTEKRGGATVEAAPKEKRVRKATPAIQVSEQPTRSDVATDVPIPTPPFYGSRVVKAIEVPKAARPASDHRRLLPQRRLRRDGRRRVPSRHDGPTRQRARARAVRAEQVPGVLLPARVRRRDGRSARRAVAPAHPRRAWNRGR